MIDTTTLTEIGWREVQSWTGNCDRCNERYADHEWIVRDYTQDDVSCSFSPSED